MNRLRLEERVLRIRVILSNVEDVLLVFGSPAFDEDYKVEARSDLTEDAFDEVERYANELADRVNRHLNQLPLPTE